MNCLLVCVAIAGANADIIVTGKAMQCVLTTFVGFALTIELNTLHLVKCSFQTRCLLLLSGTNLKSWIILRVLSLMAAMWRRPKKLESTKASVGKRRLGLAR